MPESEEEAAYTLAAYLRIASIAVSLYDYLETLPTVLRFYKEQRNARHARLSFYLLVLLRATSILVLVISNVGFFYNNFTQETCHRFFLFPPIFKVLQAMVTQSILGVRAWNLARRARSITYVLCTIYIVACILQWITTLYQRTSQLGDLGQHQNCRAFNQIRQLGAYIYYAIAVIYDFAVTAISAFFLLKYKMTSSSSLMTKLTGMMLYDGIGYFIVVAAVNLLNLILYKKAQDIQTSAASLAYCVSWIMSQRLLLHLYDASSQRRNESIEEAITITRQLESAREVSHAIRSHFEVKSRTFDLDVPIFEMREDSRQPEPSDDDVEVHVRVEHTVKLDRKLKTYELENYSRSQDTHSARYRS